FFFFSSRRRHTRFDCDWSSDVCSSDLERGIEFQRIAGTSAGSIVGSLLAAGMPATRLRKLVSELDYPSFLDRGALDRVPLIGPRSEERRVGKECRAQRPQDHEKKKDEI